jgi:hypothetical protein
MAIGTAMERYTAKIEAFVAPAFEPTETIVAATPAAPRGSMDSMIHGNGPTGMSIPGALWGARSVTPGLTQARDELALIGVPYAPQYVLVLTDRRFLWCNTRMTGKPRQLIATAPRGAVETVSLLAGQVLVNRFGILRFGFVDGRWGNFEVARAHLARAQQFVAAFRRVEAA